MTIKSEITSCLNQAFSPEMLDIVNESDQHSGPPGRESHFKVVIVSDAFEKQSLLERHKAIYEKLGSIMSKIHALSLYAYTKSEWEKRSSDPMSPLCARKR